VPGTVVLPGRGYQSRHCGVLHTWLLPWLSFVSIAGLFSPPPCRMAAMHGIATLKFGAIASDGVAGGWNCVAS
jgi:hypothetical protein